PLRGAFAAAAAEVHVLDLDLHDGIRGAGQRQSRDRQCGHHHSNFDHPRLLFSLCSRIPHIGILIFTYQYDRGPRSGDAFRCHSRGPWRYIAPDPHSKETSMKGMIGLTLLLAAAAPPEVEVQGFYEGIFKDAKFE